MTKAELEKALRSAQEENDRLRGTPMPKNCDDEIRQRDDRIRDLEEQVREHEAALNTAAQRVQQFAAMREEAVQAVLKLVNGQKAG